MALRAFDERVVPTTLTRDVMMRFHDDPFEAVIGTCEGPPDGAANHDKYIYGDRLS